MVTGFYPVYIDWDKEVGVMKVTLSRLSYFVRSQMEQVISWQLM